MRISSSTTKIFMSHHRKKLRYGSYPQEWSGTSYDITPTFINWLERHFQDAGKTLRVKLEAGGIDRALEGGTVGHGVSSA